MSIAPSSSHKQAVAAHIAELMAGFAPVQTKAMFGGFGVYRQGLMFGLIVGERLYLKVDDVSQPRFDALGLEAFTYEARGQVARLRYHEVPPEAYDEPAEMAVWARLGYECAVRQQALKAAKAAKATKGGNAGKGAAKKAAKHAQSQVGKTGPGAAAGKTGKGGPQPQAPALSDLRNLGPRSVAMLASAGITTPAQLRKLGSVRAYVCTKAACPDAGLQLLWALEGALTGRDWQAVAQTDQASLLMALEDVQKLRSA